MVCVCVHMVHMAQLLLVSQVPLQKTKPLACSIVSYLSGKVVMYMLHEQADQVDCNSIAACELQPCQLEVICLIWSRAWFDMLLCIVGQTVSHRWWPEHWIRRHAISAWTCHMAIMNTVRASGLLPVHFEFPNQLTNSKCVELHDEVSHMHMW